MTPQVTNYLPPAKANLLRSVEISTFFHKNGRNVWLINLTTPSQFLSKPMRGANVSSRNAFGKTDRDKNELFIEAMLWGFLLWVQKVQTTSINYTKAAGSIINPLSLRSEWKLMEPNCEKLCLILHLIVSKHQDNRNLLKSICLDNPMNIQPTLISQLFYQVLVKCKC